MQQKWCKFFTNLSVTKEEIFFLSSTNRCNYLFKEPKDPLTDLPSKRIIKQLKVNYGDYQEKLGNKRSEDSDNYELE